MSEKSTMIRAGGLWINKTKTGDSYMSGNLGGVRVMIFKNTYKKEGDKQPDFTMNFAENTPKEDTTTAKTSEKDDKFL